MTPVERCQGSIVVHPGGDLERHGRTTGDFDEFAERDLPSAPDQIPEASQSEFLLPDGVEETVDGGPPGQPRELDRLGRIALARGVGAARQRQQSQRKGSLPKALEVLDAEALDHGPRSLHPLQRPTLDGLSTGLLVAGELGEGVGGIVWVEDGALAEAVGATAGLTPYMIDVY